MSPILRSGIYLYGQYGAGSTKLNEMWQFSPEQRNSHTFRETPMTKANVARSRFK